MITNAAFRYETTLVGMASDEVKYPLIVCSHERSGTHFLINSIAANFAYTGDPRVDFDPDMLGSYLNFYKPEFVAQYLAGFMEVTDGMRPPLRLSSIIKSHHDANFFQKAVTDPRLRFIYIYRNPEDVLLSYWKFVLNWDWHGGLKTNSVYAFASGKPEGNGTRLQWGTRETYFDRWAQHVASWKRAALDHNILLVRYEDLRDDYDIEMVRIAQFLELTPEHGEFVKPDRDDYIKGSDMIPTDDDISRFKYYVTTRLGEWRPALI